jgi:predicted Rossmann fold flavoprotein
VDAFDIAVIGAGAAGMFCSGIAGQRGARVVLIDHAAQPGEKIRISGGGRCNFTNLAADRVDRFLGADPGFARDVLRAFPPRRFIDLVRGRGIDYHEKHRGQLFCDDSSQRILELLREGCEAGGVHWRQPCAVRAVRRGAAGGFELDTDGGGVRAGRLVVATGGLSIPKIGATDFGYRIARQFGLEVVEPRPALVPLTFGGPGWQPFAGLAGVALEVELGIDGDPDRVQFREDLLFTHRGLSGPAILQASSYWRAGEALAIDLASGRNLAAALIALREQTRQSTESALGTVLPRRLAAAWLAQSAHAAIAPRRLAEQGNRALERLAADLRHWVMRPTGTEGWAKAEVTAGGVATAGLDPRSLEARAVPGLHFVGEVVDITGWLGGYNFQWAWASAFCAAEAMTPRRRG